MKHKFKHKFLDITTHEKVVIFEYEGIKLVIAIHNSRLGPALGGLRIRDYATEEEAIDDALRLSKGMSYKNAVAGLSFGGGKATLSGNVEKIKTVENLQLCGEFIEFLQGEYISAPDMNTDIFDMVHVKKCTNHVVCLPENLGGAGDPSYFTAYGVYLSIKAGIKYKTGKDCLQNVRVGVEGVGKVGRFLVDFLVKEKASVFISDLNKEALDNIKKIHSSAIIKPSVQFEDVDVYAPCALGGTLNILSIDNIKATIIAGSANNQLQDEHIDGLHLLNKKISYIPDYVVNAGGVISAAQEFYGNFNREKTKSNIENVYNVCIQILKKSENENIPTDFVANKLAEDRLFS